MGDLVGRAGRKRLLAGDFDGGEVDALLPPLRDAVLPGDPGAVGVRVGRSDGVLDDDIVGHQCEPAVLVLRLHALPRVLRSDKRRRLLQGRGVVVGHDVSFYRSSSVYRMTPRMLRPSSMSR